MQIEVSIGEVVDKWTILSIKALNIKDKDKLVNVFKERNYLNTVINPEILHDPMTDELLKVNQFLWKVEDLLRDFERASSFGEEFVDLARSVYKLNDQRARIKKDINIKYGSDFVEEKSYQPY
jgi:predicted fused transcriptional regulator/phosphomethylpyrimidine kinase